MSHRMLIGKVLVLFCVGLAAVPCVQSIDCTRYHAYNYLNDFRNLDKCESADMVFKQLLDLTGNETIGSCRADIITKLADRYGTDAHTADHCQCSGTFKLQNYGTSSDARNKCLHHHNGYTAMYYQFFTSDHQPHSLTCRTHHLLWTHLREINDDWQCMLDIVTHIYNAFSRHGDPCTCSEKPVTTTSAPHQHQGQHDCNQSNSYRELDNLVHHSDCVSANTVFKYLNDMTKETHSGDCRRDIIDKLANQFGSQGHTPDHCQCLGTIELQDYGKGTDVRHRCWQQNGYEEMYHQFFHSHNEPNNLVCRTHHSLWTQLRKIDNHECQHDIVYHISYAFSQHTDPCSCSEKPATTTSSPHQNQDHQHCHQYNSYNELHNLLNHSECLSANTVWNILDNLQVHDSSCRKYIQARLTSAYSNISTNGNNGCVCTSQNALTDKNIHRISNGSYDNCRQQSGSTYRDIERDLFANITHHGCRNHNYLWPTLAGIKDVCEGSNCNSKHVDCTQDLIVRATLDFPSRQSDSCGCTRQESATSHTTRVTTTTTPTTHQTITPAATTKSDVMTTLQEKHDATTHSPDQHGQLNDQCYHFKSYSDLDNLMHNSKCLSANSVWHLLEDLEKQNHSCRRHIQHLLENSYNNVPTDGKNECVCTPKQTLTNKQHLHYTDHQYGNYSYYSCRHEPGSTYSAIERDLFTHITDHGCRNHNYLWPILAGVKIHCRHNNCNSHCCHDCTWDLIERAAMDYPSQDSDNCVCVENTIASSMLTTTKTKSTTQTSTPTTTTTTTPATTKTITTLTTQQTSTPTTTTTTTTVTQTTVSSHNVNGWESWSPWTCKITKSDLSATCHSYRQRNCLSNMETDCGGSSFETMDCHECSGADITYVHCGSYSQYSTCEDQSLCTNYSNTPWQICDDAAYVAKCPRLCGCCPITTTTTSTTTTTAPTTTATQTTSQGTTTIQQPSTPVPLRQCNHTCTLDAVILSTAVKHSTSDNCSSALNEALPQDCCTMGDQNSWKKGAQVQPNQVCTDGILPPYTPIAAYNGAVLVLDSAGIFYGCNKNGQSGFMMVHQTCDQLPHLLHVDGTSGTPEKDPNKYFVIY